MTSETTAVKLPTLWPRAAVKLVLFVGILLIMVFPTFLLWCVAMERPRARMACLFFSMVGRVSGVRLKMEGAISKERPLMLVANHSSYLDILVLGSLVPLSFTPKKEIRRWPIIGFLCVLADCIFIERRPADMQRVQAEIGARLATGKVIGLFPEGTTGDGFNVMPFKSGFLSLAEDHKLPVQPVSLAYTHIDTIPLSAATREKVAWIGAATFVVHFWRLLKFPSVSVTATCYDVKNIADYEDRKALAKACEQTIREGLKKTLEANGVTS